MNAKRWLACALALCLAIGQPALSEAVPEGDPEEEILLEQAEEPAPEQPEFALEPPAADEAPELSLPDEAFEPIFEQVVMEAVAPGGDDHAARFAGYVRRTLYDISASRDKKNVGYALEGSAVAVYAFLRRQVVLAAGGELDSTRFAMPLALLSPDKARYTAADLGVASVVEDGAITADAKAAFYGLLLPEGTVALVIDALLADCPYELYWYDKVLSTITTQGFRAVRADGEWALTTENASVTFSFPVEAEYSATGEQNTYELDAGRMKTVQTAAGAARSLVDSCAGLSDLDKLIAYRRAICDLTGYNGAAGDAAYGNPWQLIWVFDGDPATDVVCEGYAKAFQYLCDLTDFSGGVTCWSVTGQMRGGLGAGRHMWNIVHMEDGLNYLVDVTNCDSGTLGYPDGLFLAGGAGSPESGYALECDGAALSYAYDADMFSIFSNADLTLAAASYLRPEPDPTEEPTPEPTEEPTPDPTEEPTPEPTSEPTPEPTPTPAPTPGPTPTLTPTPTPTPEPLREGWSREDGGWRYYRKGSAVTGWQPIDGARYWFDEGGWMRTGWLRDGGDWYWFDATGAVRAGWVRDGERWYFMGEGGAMREGWLRDGGDWYYLIPGSGAMCVGWRRIDGQWYFFNASGRMKTGWISDRGRYYFLSSAGVMRTGWLRDDGDWYYLGASGAMRLGWVYHEGAWYFMGDGGAMLTDCWRYVNGRFYYFLASGRMARDQSLRLDGAVYRFGSDGAWIE